MATKTVKGKGTPAKGSKVSKPVAPAPVKHSKSKSQVQGPLRLSGAIKSHRVGGKS